MAVSAFGVILTKDFVLGPNAFRDIAPFIQTSNLQVYDAC
jgi:hypothetical protein